MPSAVGTCPGEKYIRCAVDDYTSSHALSQIMSGLNRGVFMQRRPLGFSWHRPLSLLPLVVLVGGCASESFSNPLGDSSFGAPLSVAPSSEPSVLPQSLNAISIQQEKLIAVDGTSSAYFGDAVAIDGDTAVAGAPSEDMGANEAGTVYVFTRAAGAWTLQQRLNANDAATGDQFGVKLALNGDTLFVGTEYDDVVQNVDQGSVYVFTRAGGVWTQQQKLIASDGKGNDRFGSFVSIDGDTALVGAYGVDIGVKSNQGAAYVFTRTGGVWFEQQKLTADDGEAGDAFGTSTALEGDTAIITAYLDDNSGATDGGSAYVFSRTGGVWTQQQKLIAADSSLQDSFGVSVSLSGDTALVGAYRDDTSATNDGSAYVFTRTGGVWSQQQKLVASQPAAGSLFGYGIALKADTALIGAVNDPEAGQLNRGSVYLFGRVGGIWAQQQRFAANDSLAEDRFGCSIALSATTALIGARQATIGVNANQGAAYVFNLGEANGVACNANAQCATGFCVDGVCCDSACGDGLATDCQACGVAAGAAVNGVCGPLTANTECRAAAGACDLGETCDGVNRACPDDAKAPQGTECEPASAECELPAVCDGALAECPAKTNKPNGSMCTEGTCVEGMCVIGMGVGGAGGSGGMAGAGGSGGMAGAGGEGAMGGGGAGTVTNPGDDADCGCRIAGADERAVTEPALWGMAVLVMLGRRRRKAHDVE